MSLLLQGTSSRKCYVLTRRDLVFNILEPDTLAGLAWSLLGDPGPTKSLSDAAVQPVNADEGHGSSDEALFSASGSSRISDTLLRLPPSVLSLRLRSR